MRRRRKAKYTWLPSSGGVAVGDGRLSTVKVFAVDLVDDDSSIAVIPLLNDVPTDWQHEGTSGPSMADTIGSDYIIRRVVGKFNCSVEWTADNPFTADDVVPIRVKMGLLVARAGDNGSFDLPVGWTAGGLALYNSLYLGNNREPWMFQRSWILGAGDILTKSSGGAGITPRECRALAWPSSNANYGSVSDGPHVDLKTARRVKTEERFFLTVAVENYPTPTTDPAGAVVDTRALCTFDYRVLGALRRARNQGAF